MILLVIAALGSGTRAEQQSRIAGRVVTNDRPPAPLARVLVTVRAEGLDFNRTVVTDPDGGFAFDDLPAGRFTVTAVRAPFVSSEYGAKRPGRPGTPVTLAPGQAATDLVIPLSRGAVITGIVRDGSGLPAPGVRVELVALDVAAGFRGTPIATDDRGVYRAFGLPPGRYIAMASLEDRATVIGLDAMSDEEMDEVLAALARRRAGGLTPPTAPVVAGNLTEPALDAEADSTFGYAPVFYPGTPDPSRAVAIDLGEGEERAGLDIDIALIELGAIEGRVQTSSGEPAPEARLTLARLGMSEPLRVLIPRILGRVDDGGRFSFDNLAPGDYRVTAGTSGEAKSWALADVRVGSGSTRLDLTLAPALHIAGRVVLDGAGVPDSPAGFFRLQLVDANGGEPLQTIGFPRPDGTFSMDGILPGTYTMRATNGPDDWWLRSVIVDGRDILDRPLEMGLADDVEEAVATYTSRHSELSGTLQLPAGAPATDYFIVVFPADEGLWRSGARRVQSTRPGTDGRFAFRDLPGGRYLLAALTDVEPTELADTAFLQQLATAAVAVDVADGATTVQDLRLAGGS